jgi:hypothetical protein
MRSPSEVGGRQDTKWRSVDMGTNAADAEFTRKRLRLDADAFTSLLLGRRRSCRFTSFMVKLHDGGSHIRKLKKRCPSYLTRSLSS